MVKTQTDVPRLINKYADALEKQIKVDKVILIGPYAKGEPGEWSDIEVIVISEDFAGMSHIKRLELLTRKTVGLDNWLVPYGGYTPDEYEHPEKTLHLGWVKSIGKVLYESN
ncbi:MAG: nucleotidyltransferase domain-containing protein [Chloroflexi bacterium]|nr:nucleotidyltransferase domain-containing protein [Chloroflexota bacterium]